MTYVQLYIVVYYNFLIRTQIIAKKPFPDSLRSNVAAYVGCISGAILLQDYQALMQDAGFKGELALEDVMSVVTKVVLADVLFTENPSDLNVYLNGGSTECCGPASTATCCAPAATETCSAPATTEKTALADIGNLNEWASECCTIGVWFALTNIDP